MKARRNHNSASGQAITTVVIGAGQAGLAVSYQLSQRSISHVLLERAEVGNSWSTERWDSLRMLSPNWQNQLPGYALSQPNPKGFMLAKEFSEYLKQYAEHIGAPICRNCTVHSVESVNTGFEVATNQGVWTCRTVVIATGAFNQAAVPKIAQAIPDSVASLHSADYRAPEQLPDGGVLIVGASATGLQLADEVRRSGRPVTLAVGEHVRMPRYYRGRDILWWMDTIGLLDECYTDFDDLARVRSLPSPQLVGNASLDILDLNYLRDQGVQLVGRLAGANTSCAQFSGSLANVCKMADLKMGRLLRAIDGFIDECGLTHQCVSAEPFASTRIDEVPTLTMNWQKSNVRSVIWATGYKPDYSWLNLPVMNRKGRLEHDGGVLPVPGAYAMGLPFMRKRKSSFIHGAGDDSEAIVNHLTDYLYVSANTATKFPHYVNATESENARLRVI